MQQKIKRLIKHITDTKLKKTILIFIFLLLFNALISLKIGYNFFVRTYYFMNSIVNGYTKEEKEITIENELYKLNIKADWINEKQIKVIYTLDTTENNFTLFEIDQKLNQNFFTDFEILTNSEEVKIENNKIVWTLENNLKKYNTKTLEILATLQDNQIDYQGFFPFYNSTTIKTKRKDEEKIEIKNKEKILIKNGYQIDYHWNTPSSCEFKKETIQTYHAFETAEFLNNIPKCQGYTFLGWETDEQLNKINSTAFIMPTKDIELNGVWESLSIAKRIEISKIPYQINFYIEETKLEGKEKYIQTGEKYGTLPKVEKEGLKFDGWFTKENELIEETTILTKEYDHNLYAHFSSLDES